MGIKGEGSGSVPQKWACHPKSGRVHEVGSIPEMGVSPEVGVSPRTGCVPEVGFLKGVWSPEVGVPPPKEGGSGRVTRSGRVPPGSGCIQEVGVSPEGGRVFGRWACPGSGCVPQIGTTQEVSTSQKVGVAKKGRVSGSGRVPGSECVPEVGSIQGVGVSKRVVFRVWAVPRK